MGRKGNRINPDAKVQLDGLDNPYVERVDSSGGHRLEFNNRERYLVKVQKALGLFVEQALSLPDAVRQTDPNMKLSDVLNFVEREGLTGEIYDRIVSLMLDVDHSHRVADIAKEVGMSIPVLKRLIATKDFQESYNRFFFSTVSDPRIKALQEGLSDMTPEIWRTYKDCLSPDAPYSVRAKMAMYLGEMIGVRPQKATESNSAELAEFLARKGISADNLQIIQNQNIVNIPEGYAKALQGFKEEIEIIEVVEPKADQT